MQQPKALPLGIQFCMIFFLQMRGAAIVIGGLLPLLCNSGNQCAAGNGHGRLQGKQMTLIGPEQSGGKGMECWPAKIFAANAKLKPCKTGHNYGVLGRGEREEKVSASCASADCILGDSQQLENAAGGWNGQG